MLTLWHWVGTPGCRGRTGRGHPWVPPWALLRGHRHGLKGIVSVLFSYFTFICNLLVKNLSFSLQAKNEALESGKQTSQVLQINVLEELSGCWREACPRSGGAPDQQHPCLRAGDRAGGLTQPSQSWLAASLQEGLAAPPSCPSMRAGCRERLVLALLNRPHAPCGECFLSLTPYLYFLSSRPLSWPEIAARSQDLASGCRSIWPPSCPPQPPGAALSHREPESPSHCQEMPFLAFCLKQSSR